MTTHVPYVTTTPSRGGGQGARPVVRVEGRPRAERGSCHEEGGKRCSSGRSYRSVRKRQSTSPTERGLCAGRPRAQGMGVGWNGECGEGWNGEWVFWWGEGGGKREGFRGEGGRGAVGGGGGGSRPAPGPPAPASGPAHAAPRPARRQGDDRTRRRQQEAAALPAEAPITIAAGRERQVPSAPRSCHSRVCRKGRNKVSGRGRIPSMLLQWPTLTSSHATRAGLSRLRPL